METGQPTSWILIVPLRNTLLLLLALIDTLIDPRCPGDWVKWIGYPVPGERDISEFRIGKAGGPAQPSISKAANKWRYLFQVMKRRGMGQMRKPRRGW